MTREEFIAVLDRKGYSYETEGDKIMVTHKGSVYLNRLKTLPPGVHFENGRDVILKGLGWVNDNERIRIEGVENKRLLNLMIKQGVLI